MTEIQRSLTMQRVGYLLLSILVWSLLVLSLSSRPLQAKMLYQEKGITATVQVKALNIRSGPGTNYSRIGGVARGDVLTVVGQVRNCSWLQIRTAQNLDGWVAGTVQYVKLSEACAAISAVAEPASSNVSTPSATAIPQTATQTPTAVPATTSTNPPAWLAPGVDPNRAAELEAKVPLEAGMACVLFQNFMGGTLHIALNNHKEAAPYSLDLFLKGGEERPVCLPSGLYFFYLDTIGYNRLQDSVRFYPDTRDVFAVMGK